MHRYTQEQADFLRDNVKGITSNELTEKFNKHFGLNLGMNQIRAYCKNHKLTNGLNTTFKKGQEAHNKGKKIWWTGGEATRFYKGQAPTKYRPVGSERVNVDGYIEVKVSDPNKWQLKHKLVWEKRNGPMPKGHAIIFADKNRLNLDIDNLLLVTRKQLLIMNQYGLTQDYAEGTKAGINIAKVHERIFDAVESMDPGAAELRKLYVEQGLTTEQIAKKYGVGKFTAYRWLVQYDIPRRPQGSGRKKRRVAKYE